MMASHQRSRSRNIRNAAIAALVPIPALLFHFSFLNWCPNEARKGQNMFLQSWGDVCAWGREHPIGLLNVVFFLNVDVLFWVISLVQRSTWVVFWNVSPPPFCFMTYLDYSAMSFGVHFTHGQWTITATLLMALRVQGLFHIAICLKLVDSVLLRQITRVYLGCQTYHVNIHQLLKLSSKEKQIAFKFFTFKPLIDPYWTIIPVIIGHFYGTHPYARSNYWRSNTVMSLLWIWSIRLTHSYFRRENWQCGEREDWRFSQLREQHPSQWWWMSFFAVYLSQQIFLVGICLPIYAIYSNLAPWNNWDTLATILYGAGIVIAYFADTQLHTFMSRNSMLKELGVPPTPLLLEGLWCYSRHPNYFGEQLCWWSLAVYAWNLGQGWMVAGTVVNSLGLAYVTVMVERKMLEKSSRADLYRRYQETTSVWVPWFKFKPSKGAKGSL